MSGEKKYINLPVDERTEKLEQEHAWCVRIHTRQTSDHYPGPRLNQMSKWLDKNVNTWQAVSVHDKSLDISIYIDTARQAQLFALRWSEYVVCSRATLYE